jgi:hypothetical protein
MDLTNSSTSSTLKTSRRVTLFGRPYLWIYNDEGRLALIPDFAEQQFEVYRQLLRESGLRRPLPPGDYTLTRHAHGS